MNNLWHRLGFCAFVLNVNFSLSSWAHDGKFMSEKEMGALKVKNLNFSTLNGSQKELCKGVTAFYKERPKHCQDSSIYNKGILEAICAIKAGGGYNAALKAIPTSVHSLKIGTQNVFDAKFRESSSSPTSSYCGGASYSAFMMMLENLGEQNPLNNISVDQAKNFDFYNYIEQSDGNFKYGNVSKVAYLSSKSPARGSDFKMRDFLGLFGSFNNDYGGVVDASTAFDFGRNIKSKAEACPGDLLKFDRNDGHGHSVVYLGEFDKKFCYWSSNGKGVPKEHEGFSIRCEKTSAVKAWNFVRVTDKVRNLARIKPYDGTKVDWKNRGSGLMTPDEDAQYRKERIENDVEAELRLGVGTSRKIKSVSREHSQIEQIIQRKR